MKSIIQVLLAFFIVFFGPQIQQDSTAQISVKKCSVCGKPVNNCTYKGNHPKCSVCGKVKERCPYKGNHPKCSTCGKYKDQCPYKGNHPKEKETYTVNGVQFTMIRVEGNGSPYYIGETEVTQALWQAVMGSLPSDISSSSYDVRGINRPVCYVNCDDCEQFIRKLNSITGKTFRLPSDSEWVYAAKGGKYTHNYTYSGSNNIDDVAWYTSNTNDSGSRDVKTKRPNELGIYDMSGNVCEWTSTMSGSLRVNRGGGWSFYAVFCAVTDRNSYTPTLRSHFLGLRLAL